MLQVYGQSIASYKGKGTVSFKQGRELKGTFKAIQLPDGQIYIYVLTSHKDFKTIWPKSSITGLGKLRSDIEKIIGTLDDGRQLETLGSLHLVTVEDYLGILNRKRPKLVFSSQSIEIRDRKNKQRVQKMRFHVTNLRFLGTEWYWKIKNRIGYRITPIKFKGLWFKINPREDASQRIAEMRATKQCNLTSFIDVVFLESMVQGFLHGDTEKIVLHFASGVTHSGKEEIEWPSRDH